MGRGGVFGKKDAPCKAVLGTQSGIWAVLGWREVGGCLRFCPYFEILILGGVVDGEGLLLLPHIEWERGVSPSAESH